MLACSHGVTPDGDVVFRAAGDLDALTVAQFRRCLGDLLPCDRLVIDVAGVSFLDSSGLGAIVGGIRRVREIGGQVAIACSRDSLLRLLRESGFEQAVTLSGSVEEAAATLHERPGQGRERRVSAEGGGAGLVRSSRPGP